MASLENWNRSAESRPREIVVPTSVAQVVDVVKDHQRYPSPVRAAGQLHSTTLCIEADGGTQLRMDHFNDVVNLTGSRITVRAGATMIQVRDALRRHRLELPVSPEIGNATAGSVACGGSKDSSLRLLTAPSGLGQIGSSVVQVKMVDARGDVLVVDDSGATVETTGQRLATPTLSLVRSSYGLLGIIVEVTFAAVSLTLLDNSFHWMNLRDAFGPGVSSVDKIFDGAATVLAFLQPYSDGILIERRRVVESADGSPEPSEEDTFRRRIRDWLWEWGASEGTTLLTGLGAVLAGSTAEGQQSLVRSGIEFLFGAAADNTSAQWILNQAANPVGRAVDGVMDRLAQWARSAGNRPSDEVAAELLQFFDPATSEVFKNVVNHYKSYRSDSLIDFTHHRSTFFDFTFWAFPLSDFATIVPAYVQFCRQYEKGEYPDAVGEKYRPALFTEMYFICQDTHADLSFSPNGPIFTLDMVDTRPSNAAWKAMNRAFNAWAVRHGGRPLMNQTKELQATPQVVGTAYGSAWTKFSTAVWAANPPIPTAPDGRFVNGYFRKLLTPRPPA